jgi:hypothetical protein
MSSDECKQGWRFILAIFLFKFSCQKAFAVVLIVNAM